MDEIGFYENMLVRVRPKKGEDMTREIFLVKKSGVPGIYNAVDLSEQEVVAIRVSQSNFIPFWVQPKDRFRKKNRQVEYEVTEVRDSRLSKGYVQELRVTLTTVNETRNHKTSVSIEALNTDFYKIQKQ